MQHLVCMDQHVRGVDTVWGCGGEGSLSGTHKSVYLWGSMYVGGCVILCVRSWVCQVLGAPL